MKAAALVTVVALSSVALVARCGGKDASTAAGVGGTGVGGRGGGGAGGAHAGASAAAGASGSAGSAGTAGAPSAGAAGAGGTPGVRTVVGGNCPPSPIVWPHTDLTWTQYSGFGCELPFVVPGPDTPPQPPFTWGPCPSTASPTGECEQLQPLPDGQVGIAPFGFALSEGRAIIGVYRYRPGDDGYGHYAIGEADGPILQAITAFGSTFGMSLSWFDGAAYAMSVSAAVGSAATEHGVVAGRFGDPAPSYARRLPNPTTGGTTSSSWAISKDLVVRNLDGIHATRWLQEDGPLVYDPLKDPDGLPGFVRQVMGDRVFVEVNANGLMGVVSWTEAEGVRPVIRYYGDFEKSAQRWRTDGKDMVWVEGEGPQVSIYVHPKMTVMTAPYSTDAAVIQQTKRSLGPSPAKQAAPIPFPVGCGYAATPWYNETETANGLAIVRLSDGVWWRLVPKTFPYPTRPLGITCEHVYYSFANQVLRIKLSSLPPGGLP